MTQNQIAYWTLQETKRSNLINEAEQKRSNIAREAENTRSNVAKETELNRSNLIREAREGKLADAQIKRWGDQTNLESIKIATDVIGKELDTAKMIGSLLI